MRFQKIYGLNTAECHKVEKWSGRLGSGWVWWVWWVCVGDGWVVSGSVDSGSHLLSENIWFVWSKASYSGDKWRCHRCGTDGRTNERQTAESRNNIQFLSSWNANFFWIFPKLNFEIENDSAQVMLVTNLTRYSRTDDNRKENCYCAVACGKPPTSNQTAHSLDETASFAFTQKKIFRRSCSLKGGFLFLNF